MSASFPAKTKGDDQNRSEVHKWLRGRPSRPGLRSLVVNLQSVRRWCSPIRNCGAHGQTIDADLFDYADDRFGEVSSLG